jgi:Ca2+-binding RTX toxin-like protein
MKNIIRFVATLLVGTALSFAVISSASAVPIPAENATLSSWGGKTPTGPNGPYLDQVDVLVGNALPNTTVKLEVFGCNGGVVNTDSVTGTGNFQADVYVSNHAYVGNPITIRYTVSVPGFDDRIGTQTVSNAYPGSQCGGSGGGGGGGTVTTPAFPDGALIRGTSGKNVLVGTPGNDVIYGLGGNDKIYGMGGNDVIIGGKGTDKCFGGEGADTFRKCEKAVQ